MTVPPHPNGRPRGTPKKMRQGWLVEVNVPHVVEGRKGDINVNANLIEGDLTGVWIYDAGVDGMGQNGFKVCGDPDFLAELGDAFHRMSEEIRERAGWNGRPKRI